MRDESACLGNVREGMEGIDEEHIYCHGKGKSRIVVKVIVTEVFDD